MMGKSCDLVLRDGQDNMETQILFRDRETELNLAAGALRASGASVMRTLNKFEMHF